MLLSCFAPWEHAGQADCRLSGALLACLSSAELAAWLRLVALEVIDELMGNQVWMPGLRRAMLCRY